MPGPALIGLTGGIAAGKSEALRILGELGAATLSTDEVVHELLGGDAEVAELLIGRWGERVAPGGELDRGRIAGVVFERPEELAWLESLLHPRVGERVQDWRRSLQNDVDVAVVEVPLLFEGAMTEVFDATIAVVADDGERARRAADRGTGELTARTTRQLTQAEKAARASFVVRNDGSIADLESDLAELYPRLEAAGR